MDVWIEMVIRLGRLPPRRQAQALRFVACLSAPVPKGEPGAALRRFQEQSQRLNLIRPRLFHLLRLARDVQLRAQSHVPVVLPFNNRRQPNRASHLRRAPYCTVYCRCGGFNLISNVFSASLISKSSPNVW